MLVFPLKKQWYEKIKSGEKTIEYREVKDYWTKRLASYTWIGHVFESFCRHLMFPEEYQYDCKLRLGYTNKYMTAKIAKIEVVNGKYTDLAIDKPVYAIHLADVKELEK